MFDLEMLEQMGHCNGIENYSRHLSGRTAGEPPPTLIDYFPKDYLAVRRRVAPDGAAGVVDVQRRPLAQGDAGRLRFPPAVGARQPAAQVRRVGDSASARSSTCRRRRATTSSRSPRASSSSRSSARRGCSIPVIEIRPVKDQVDDLLGEIRERVKAGDRVLVTTLTKRMAEDLTEYFTDLGVRVRYLHSDVDTLERIEIIRDLRKRRVRRAGRHQPLARGARSARGVAGGDPRRRQRGLLCAAIAR